MLDMQRHENRNAQSAAHTETIAWQLVLVRMIQ